MIRPARRQSINAASSTSVRVPYRQMTREAVVEAMHFKSPHGSYVSAACGIAAPRHG